MKFQIPINSGRVQLDRNEFQGFNVNYGTSLYVNSDLGNANSIFDPTHRVPGYIVPYDCDLVGFKMWGHNNNANSQHQWKLIIFKQIKKDDSTSKDNKVIYADETPRIYGDTVNHLIDLKESDFNDNFELKENEIISLAFSRETTGGSTRYYWYIHSACFILERP